MLENNLCFSCILRLINYFYLPYNNGEKLLYAYKYRRQEIGLPELYFYYK